MKKYFFQKTTTANPPKMDDKVVFLIVRRGILPSVVSISRREICRAMGYLGELIDDRTFEMLCRRYCEEVLEVRYPRLLGSETEYWCTRHDLAVAVQRYSKSNDEEDRCKAEVLKKYVNELSNFFPVYASVEQKRENAEQQRRCQKENPRKLIFIAEPFKIDQCCREIITEMEMEKDDSILNLDFINTGILQPAQQYPIALVQFECYSGTQNFALYFYDEEILIYINESDAQLVHRFLNENPRDVLNCIEREQTQEILQKASRKALARSKCFQT